MTKEEAKKELSKLIFELGFEDNVDDKVYALNMAIQALSQEPCDDAISRPTVVKFEGTNMACMGGDEIMKEFENNTQQNNDDAISREAVKKVLSNHFEKHYYDYCDVLEEDIDELPSVTQKSAESEDKK